MRHIRSKNLPVRCGVRRCGYLGLGPGKDDRKAPPWSLLYLPAGVQPDPELMTFKGQTHLAGETAWSKNLKDWANLWKANKRSSNLNQPGAFPRVIPTHHPQPPQGVSAHFSVSGKCTYRSQVCILKFAHLSVRWVLFSKRDWWTLLAHRGWGGRGKSRGWGRAIHFTIALNQVANKLKVKSWVQIKLCL